jgi:hypothetical protein
MMCWYLQTTVQFESCTYACSDIRHHTGSLSDFLGVLIHWLVRSNFRKPFIPEAFILVCLCAVRYCPSRVYESRCWCVYIRT